MTMKTERLGAHRAVALGDGAAPEPRVSAAGRLLLVGEDNPQSDNPELALWPHEPGVAGQRLQDDVLGLAHEVYASIWRTNLCSPNWSAAAARKRASLLLADRGDTWTHLALLGQKVRNAFGKVLDGDKLECFQLVPLEGGVTLITIPHPSGRCREWNDPKNYRRARALFRHALPALGVP